jgi:hypothetical protein
MAQEYGLGLWLKNDGFKFYKSCPDAFIVRADFLRLAVLLEGLPIFAAVHVKTAQIHVGDVPTIVTL